MNSPVSFLANLRQDRLQRSENVFLKQNYQRAEALQRKY